jgi:galactokinase
MNKKLIRGTSTFFQEKFNQTPSYHISSPGRINLIGEHIDYNSGSVLLGTIDKAICFAISKSETNQSTVYAKDMYAVKTFHWAANLPIEQDTWFGYIQGVLEEFKKRKLPLCNFNMVFSSNIPMGSGLSSSAALECGFAYALNVLFNLKLSKLEIVKIGQQAENNFAGVQCGIMDQFASVFGKKDHIQQLNCNTLETEYHRIQLDAQSLVLLNSGVKHTLLDSSYNNRREECAQ